MPATAVSNPTTDAPWRAGVQCARTLAYPGCVLVTAAATVAISYYHVEAVHDVLERLAVIRVKGGFVFSAVSTALFAGVIPFLYLRLNPATRAMHPWPHLAFFVLFWGYKGIEVDFVYRLQAVMFGTGVSAATVIKKMLVDQFIYNALFAAPYGVLVFGWKDAGFRWGPPLADFRQPRWYYRRVLPVMLAVLAVWMPATCCIYAMPAALQLPLNSLVNCFWVILFCLMLTRQRPCGA